MVCRDGRWRLYVVVPRALTWPTHYFPGCSVVPTVQERSRALALLGYVLADGADWTWTEDSERPDDPSTPVVLIAAADARSRDGGAG
ncbi:DUF6303 family protein [Streptomyces bambusae]|uniref:DUF6303 family protein n=1 Tax=Streptomyces bambusae TaxID=1550616 RepID=UPI0027E0E32C|nr:DUF6303 family protein [Streptomyces bambusae]